MKRTKHGEVLYGHDWTIAQIDQRDNELLKLRTKYSLLKKQISSKRSAINQKNKEQLARIEELQEEIKNVRRKNIEEKERCYDENISLRKKSKKDHNQIISFTEKQIEKQIRSKKYDWKSISIPLSDQIDAFINLIQYTSDQFKNDKNPNITVIAKLLSVTQRNVESMKVKLDAIESQYKFETGLLHHKTDKVTHNKDKLVMTQKTMAERVKAYEESRRKEENDFCDNLNYLYKEMIEAQQEKLRTAEEKRDLMKQIALESTEKLNKAKLDLENLEKIINEKQQKEIGYVDINGIKAKLRIEHIILKQLRDENGRLRANISSTSTLIEESSTITSSLTTSSYVSSN